MAWDEWEQLKQEAARKRSARMELDQAPGGGGNAQSDLTVTHKDLDAIGERAFTLWNHLGKAGRHAEPSSQKAASDLKSHGLRLGTALDTTQKQWEKQLTSLLDACAQITNHMDFTKKTHQGDEHRISGKLSSIATLDKGFDEKSTG